MASPTSSTCVALAPSLVLLMTPSTTSAFPLSLVTSRICECVSFLQTGAAACAQHDYSRGPGDNADIPAERLGEVHDLLVRWLAFKKTQDAQV